jgi:hypothetical protein
MAKLTATEQLSLEAANKVLRKQLYEFAEENRRLAREKKELEDACAAMRRRLHSPKQRLAS